MAKEPPVSERINGELKLIRQNVPGVRGSITASSDGLLVAEDVHDLEPTQIAALVAAMHAVAVRAVGNTHCGQLKEVITRGSEGYLAVYTAGTAAIVAVLGTAELNVGMLNLQARAAIERIAAHSAGPVKRRPAAAGSSPQATKPAGPAGQNGTGPLPARRPRGSQQARAN
ncbi:MAG TPA: roadblock/LC7 domain-containing protein [Trebonia sp.]|nr:roadblock/LC7 domain-containing protein [Trebonia sp.]